MSPRDRLRLGGWSVRLLRPDPGEPRWGFTSWCAGSVALHTPLRHVSLHYPPRHARWVVGGLRAAGFLARGLLALGLGYLAWVAWTAWGLVLA